MSNESARTTLEAKQRGQAVAGALAGLVVVLVLVGVFIGVKVAGSGKSDAAAAPVPTASQPAAQPTDQPTDQPTAAQPTAPPVDVPTPAALRKAPTVKAGQGKVTKLVVTPLVKGTGAVVRKGQTITANYVVVLYKTGQVVDSSWTTGGAPISTPIGVGQVIKGWDEAIPGQRVGSRLQIDIPEALAYPGKGDLRFVVDLLAAK